MYFLDFCYSAAELHQLIFVPLALLSLPALLHALLTALLIALSLPHCPPYFLSLPFRFPFASSLGPWFALRFAVPF